MLGAVGWRRGDTSGAVGGELLGSRAGFVGDLRCRGASLNGARRRPGDGGFLAIAVDARIHGAREAHRVFEDRARVLQYRIILLDVHFHPLNRIFHQKIDGVAFLGGKTSAVNRVGIGAASHFVRALGLETGQAEQRCLRRITVCGKGLGAAFHGVQIDLAHLALSAVQ